MLCHGYRTTCIFGNPRRGRRDLAAAISDSQHHRIHKSQRCPQRQQRATRPGAHRLADVAASRWRVTGAIPRSETGRSAADGATRRSKRIRRPWHGPRHQHGQSLDRHRVPMPATSTPGASVAPMVSVTTPRCRWRDAGPTSAPISSIRRHLRRDLIARAGSRPFGLLSPTCPYALRMRSSTSARWSGPTMLSSISDVPTPDNELTSGRVPIWRRALAVVGLSQ